jgi:uncharacterized protein (DUF849 family)
LAAWDAGAAVLQLYPPVAAHGSLARAAERIRSAGCDAILSSSWPPAADGPTPLDSDWSKIGLDFVSLDCRAAATPDGGVWASALVRHAAALAEKEVELDVVCAGPRDVERVLELRDAGLLPDPLRFQLLIEPQGDDSMVDAMTDAIASLPPGAIWYAGASGLGQLPANLYALVAGGHLRTGLADNPWLVEDVPATDEQLVQRLVRIVDEFDRPLATPDEARESLRLLGAGEPALAARAANSQALSADAA